MSYETRQKTRYKGNDLWHWSIWIEGSKPELDTIQSATYYLHPTFPQRVRRIGNRSTKFRLDSAGWGGFTIRIVLELDSGEKLGLSHDLELRYPEPAISGKAGSSVKKSARSTRRKPDRGFSNIYVSSAASDAPLAAMVRDTLKKRKIEPKEISISSYAPVELSVRKAIRESDALVAVKSTAPSGWVESEVEFAKSSGIPVITVDAVKKEVRVEENPKTSPKTSLALEKLSTSLGQTLKASLAGSS